MCVQNVFKSVLISSFMADIFQFFHDFSISRCLKHRASIPVLARFRLWGASIWVGRLKPQGWVFYSGGGTLFGGGCSIRAGGLIGVPIGTCNFWCGLDTLYGTVIKEMINDLCLKAQGIPLPERLAPRHTKPGNLDLTASTLFVQDAETHARLAHVLNPSNVLVPFRGAQINVGSALQMLLSTLRALHQFWRQKPILTLQ